jgi:hypothetical protein
VSWYKETYHRKRFCWHFWREKFDCGVMGSLCMGCWRKHSPPWAGMSIIKDRPKEIA